jgi:hypothetical protein
MDKESTEGMAIQPEIISSWMRNLPEERLFRSELSAQGRSILQRNGILPEMTR